LQFDIKGRNFLHVAVQKGDLESVLFLLSVCVNLNSRVHDSTQMTPLHLAVISGNEMIVRNLVRTLHTANLRISTNLRIIWYSASHCLISCVFDGLPH